MTSPSATLPKSSAHSPADVPLVQYRDGSIYALSLSEPGTVYRVTVEPASCTCKGFTHRGHCCHVAAAVARFAPPCYWCGSSVAVTVYDNEWDNSEIALCAACFTKEA